MEAEIKPLAQVQEGNRATGAKFRSLWSQPYIWVILPPILSALWLVPCLDKPSTPIPFPLLPTEGLFLGQRLSLLGAAGKRARAENTTFTLSFLAEGDGRKKLVKN